MTIQNLSLLKAIGAKMDYLDRRQSLISQNIANADTPGFRPKDLQKVDFSRLVSNIAGESKGGVQKVSMKLTNPQHQIPGGVTAQDARVGKEKDIYEVAPAGNAVVLEEQLLNAGQVATDYNLMTSLYQKNVRLIKTALGTA